MVQPSVFFLPLMAAVPEKGLPSHPSQESCSTAVGTRRGRGGQQWVAVQSRDVAVRGRARESGPATPAAPERVLYYGSRTGLSQASCMCHMDMAGVPRGEWKDTRDLPCSLSVKCRHRSRFKRPVYLESPAQALGKTSLLVAGLGGTTPQSFK